MTFRVSSRHLTLASPVFKAALTGGWKEGIKAQNDCLEIGAEDWDVDAMLIAMNIVHCRPSQVPLTLGLEKVAKLAVLVDYYQFHDAFYSHKRHWIPALEESIPQSFNKELMLWMCIAWVFDDGKIFTDSTRVAVQHHTGHLRSLELPIPSTIIGKSGLPIAVVIRGGKGRAQVMGHANILLDWIVEKRTEAITALVGALHELMQAFLDESKGCSFACRSMLLGALRKQLYDLKLLDPEVKPLFQGWGLAEAIKRVEEIKEPAWCSNYVARSNYYGDRYCRAHGCSLKKMIEPHLGQTRDAMTGLKLSDFK